MKKVQRRTAHYVTNKYHSTSSVTSMIDHLKWKSLETHRNINRVTMIYEFTHQLIALDPKLYLLPQPIKNTRFTNSLQGQTFSTKTDNCFFHTLLYSGIHFHKTSLVSTLLISPKSVYLDICPVYTYM